MREGHSVTLSFDHTTASKVVASDSHDIIMIDDSVLDAHDNTNIIGQIRSAKIHTPILLLAFKQTINDPTWIHKSGIDDYLLKPFSFQTLLSQIAALGGSTTSIPEIIEYADLRVDTNNYEVRRSNEIIKLSNREFALIEFMIRNPDKTLTKESIIANVWHYDARILPNTVEVYIRYLRNKIDKPFDSPALIHTIRGYGYKLSVNS